MQILDSPSTDPHFNIAAEEYLMKESTSDYAFFYINDPSVIVGKHQNAWAEVNIPWTREHNIPVVRRISGGGTVWHDQGNLNFSFILNGEEGRLVDFRRYAWPILDFLMGMGLPAEFGKRNEMLIRGLKISGNAEHIWRKRVLHHGTLLYSADLNRLQQSLDSDPERFTSKAVQSVRSRTANIADFLEGPRDISEFRKNLLEYITAHFERSGVHHLTEKDYASIGRLVKEKYSQWKWNIGYSPRYSLERELILEGITVHAELSVEKGQIRDCKLRGGIEGLPELAMQLIGIEHEPGRIVELLRARKLVGEQWIDKFVKALF